MVKNKKIEFKYPYDEWLFENNRGFGLLSLPLIGWVVSIVLFGFVFPIQYFISKNEKFCKNEKDCKNCKNFKPK